MTSVILTGVQLLDFRTHLLREEKSPVTVEKYLRDASAFVGWLNGQPVSKERVVAYKQRLTEQGYKVRSINSMLASINSFLAFAGASEYRVKTVRTQRSAYCSPEKELTKEEYLRLLEAARNSPRLHLLLQTICGTGIRVSELQYFTVEAAAAGEVTVRCKSKTRTILIPGKLRKLLLAFCEREKIASGAIFITRSGRPLDRSNIWAQMKKLCAVANVAASKVFPHNLRKLFARTFYSLDKDIAKLADLLGHGSIETTRIYLMTTGLEHQRELERMGLVV